MNALLFLFVVLFLLLLVLLWWFGGSCDQNMMVVVREGCPHKKKNKKRCSALGVACGDELKKFIGKEEEISLFLAPLLAVSSSPSCLFLANQGVSSQI
jgi:hypothetical protein